MATKIQLVQARGWNYQQEKRPSLKTTMQSKKAKVGWAKTKTNKSYSAKCFISLSANDIIQARYDNGNNWKSAISPPMTSLVASHLCKVRQNLNDMLRRVHLQQHQKLWSYDLRRHHV